MSTRHRFLVVDNEGHSYLTDGKTGHFYRVTVDVRPRKPERVEQVYALVSDKEPRPEPYTMTPDFIEYKKILKRRNLL